MLAESDRRILDFERWSWTLPVPKDRTVLDVLGMPAAAYYARLRELVGSKDAHDYDPLTVRRLRRVMSREAS